MILLMIAFTLTSIDKKAIEKLYAVAYTIKMSKKGTYQIPDYFDFVVPPTRRTMVARWYHWN